MTLATFLFSDYRRKVLALMLLHPDVQYHQREIARLTDTISGTLSRELAKMVKVGLLLKMPVGNQMHYKANVECPIFLELAGILRKTDGWVTALADSLKPLAESIEFAFVFGSMASGNATSSSDIDLMVVGDVSFSDLITQLYPLQTAIRREINPKCYSRGEWVRLMSEPSAFVRDVLNKPTLFLMGDSPNTIAHKS
ncbi:nucleotidyltransferase domain-containing protein [Pseudomonas sp. CCI3.2]|uniref:nucleotidyltransferase domain-containing protein n=1 Tax=unclassified Pseudomonas TaxID=196821 RepID=UPI002AC95BB7|nr:MULTISPECIES: nucleotidyltransferase domain-containing protein [unclassified Pseudomonas]MEB0075831.1 nucleotidyltransferase domain-containing protein [Pseudomonas sp. MH10out]MEB0102771.1 nucleotidyltransferase domain-containing protein [Pseudomonas sp. CCI3.2]MEB0131585.1 nucleotidyltransferase domain-containing protein [Pseudomonas sp. CCI2.4]MEB0156478.1 nucleotidyltransferase domain-containing protein [Pseudomonas sp. AH2 (2023)]MEB0170111.1 nucleotidyltransferase domain-containing pro